MQCVLIFESSCGSQQQYMAIKICNSSQLQTFKYKQPAFYNFSGLQNSCPMSDYSQIWKKYNVGFEFYLQYFLFYYKMNFKSVVVEIKLAKFCTLKIEIMLFMQFTVKPCGGLFMITLIFFLYFLCCRCIFRLQEFQSAKSRSYKARYLNFRGSTTSNKVSH